MRRERLKASNKLPTVTWLRVTDYMHGWLQEELGGISIREQRVLSVQHLKGAKEVMRMPTVDDIMEAKPVDKSMSVTRMNCVLTGMDLDAHVTEQLYGINREQIKQFVPIECPKMCITKNGVLRPWTPDVRMSREQATKMQQVIRDAFWQSVADFNTEYAIQQDGEHYPVVEMIEEFCMKTNTPALHVEALRREWQRRCKRTAVLDS